LRGGEASVILAAYGRPEVLGLCLAAYVRQSHTRFEVVVADDGSPESYEDVLEAYSARFSLPIQHVRQDDRGFRKARILNRAIAVASFPSLIFADFDCLPHARFVEDHLVHLEGGTAVSGRRVHVERAALPSEEQILSGGLRLSTLRLLSLALAGKARVIEHGISTPFFYEAGQSALFGSNFSARREDLLGVNGFNEEYEAPGTGEDTDLDLRLKRSGVRVRVFRNRMIQYHLAHPSPLYDDPKNLAILERIRGSGVVRAPIGLAEIRPGDATYRTYASRTTP
jgi:cellulose synthase/poly-beta-1,6-N-acetylglucosamine synthase-like glycosyltransferase